MDVDVLVDELETLSHSSSAENLSLLDPQDYEEIVQSTPSIHILSGGPEIVREESDDDLSEYISQPSIVTEDDEFTEDVSGTIFEEPHSSLHLDTAHLSPSSAAVVTSPTEFISSAFSGIDIRSPSTSGISRSPSWSGETMVVASARGEKKRRLYLEEDDPWRPYLSHALKEEIRCKIQLKRINTGQEELKVDFTEPEPTISYDAVQRRNEVRERNKFYAKQSRDRARHERNLLKEENSRLMSERDALKREIQELKTTISVISDSESFVHSKDCPQASAKKHSVHDVASTSASAVPVLKSKAPETVLTTASSISPKKRISILSFGSLAKSPESVTYRYDKSASTADSDDVITVTKTKRIVSVGRKPAFVGSTSGSRRSDKRDLE